MTYVFIHSHPGGEFNLAFAEHIRWYIFRMLVYEYVNNGNLEQWLHGAMRHHGYLTWEARIKILLGTAKA